MRGLSCLVVLLGMMLSHACAQPVDLLQRYPTKLTEGDLKPERARSWQFSQSDIFQLSRFTLEVGKDLRIESGKADLGLGKSVDGAVWAVVIPKEPGKLTGGPGKEESVSHVWLRFHPKEINHLIPSETVSADGLAHLHPQMLAIARAKASASYQAGGRAMIPGPKDMTVDVDTTAGPRRFFIVDTAAATAKYEGAFENQPVKLPGPLTAADAQAAFDQLWEAFDRVYAGFSLRPEVDWDKLRAEHRPKALASKTPYEFAAVCADMLRPLRDLHVWLTLAGSDVSVFNRPRAANANPAAWPGILGPLNRSGRSVQWAVTDDKIGYLGIYSWSEAEIPAQVHAALEKLKETRGLVLDVRLNGGGSETLAQEVAGRFLKEEFVYGYSRVRNGPAHGDLSAKRSRKVVPLGPWRYEQPVVVLIGERCMSSNESFIKMLGGAPNATTMGDRTCGSSGNPKTVQLPMQMTVSVPQWIDYLPDGTALDERGIQPAVMFKGTPGAFEGQRDDLLAAALERLRKAN